MAIFDQLKSIGKILQEAGKIEQYQQILDALQKLLEMQKKIEELETENRKLNKKLKTKRSLIFENNVYWMNDGDKKSGPFCKVCYENEDKIITLDVGDFRLGVQSDPVYYRYYCLVCKNYFK